MQLQSTTTSIHRIDSSPRSLKKAKYVGLVIVLTVSAVCQQIPSAEPPQPSTTQQTPDAPSSTKQEQQSSFGHGVKIVVKTIGQDEWHLLSAPFRIDSVGFTDKTPFVNKTLF